MEHEVSTGVVFLLYRKDGVKEVAVDQLEMVVASPEIIPVPGAPSDVAGMTFWHGSLRAVFGPAQEAGSASAGCVAMIKRDDGTIYGETADEIGGGERVDTLYR